MSVPYSLEVTIKDHMREFIKLKINYDKVYDLIKLLLEDVFLSLYGDRILVYLDMDLEPCTIKLSELVETVLDSDDVNDIEETRAALENCLLLFEEAK